MARLEMTEASLVRDSHLLVSFDAQVRKHLSFSGPQGQLVKVVSVAS